MLAQSPFDILAETYDTDFTQSEIGRLLRHRVWKVLNILFKDNRPLRILELNCGTGDDALKLAAMGHSVVATDASGMMIEKAQQKLASSKINSGKIEFIQCSFSEVLQNFKHEKFDLAFSNFGGINCIDKNEIATLASDLYTIINPGGRLLLTVMSRFCFWETGYYILKGKLNTAFRRQKKAIYFTVNGTSMRVFYYSPRELKKLFQPKFQLLQTFPVGLFIPPSYLEKQFSNRRHLLNKLSRWEDSFGNYGILSPMADHYSVILKKI